MNEEILHQIEQVIGYKFSDVSLLKISLTHSSSVEDRSHSNERLEFLGDSILGLVICQRLFERFPEYLEGDLTKIKSNLVSRKTCAKIARDIGLHGFLKLGKGMFDSAAISSSLAAGVLESIIAAIYIDGGFAAAEKFILDNYGYMIEQADAAHSQGNYKSVLQQHAQPRLNTTPTYVLLDEKGPDHDKCFESEVVIDDRHFKSAWGNNKKEAEQKAAYNALIELGVIQEPHPDEHI